MKWFLLLPLLIATPINPTAAQLPDAPKPKSETALVGVNRERHRFYDKPGVMLLGTATALAATDVGISCYEMDHGGVEVRTPLNPFPAKNCAQLGVQLFGQVLIQEGVAYLFHKKGHHKLERITRFFSIEQNTYGIIYTKTH